MNSQTTPSVGFFEAGKLYFKNATNFKGRSRRSEYWKGTLFLMLINVVGGIVLGLLMGLLGEVGSMIGGVIGLVWSIFCFIASLSLCFRRLHDTGRSGWFYLMILIPLGIGSIILLVFYCMDSTEDNKWGPNPKLARRQAAAAPVPPVKPVAPAIPVAPAKPAAPAIPVEPVQHTAPVQPVIPASNVSATVYQPAAAARKPQGVLKVRNGSMAGKSFRFPEGTVITIGRNPAQCDVVLSEYNVVSGVHCKVKFEDRAIILMDMNSTNGTYIDDVRLTPGEPTALGARATLQLSKNGCILDLYCE